MMTDAINGAFSFFTDDNFVIETLFNLHEIIEIVIIVLFNLFIVFFKINNRKLVLWLLCYLYVASSFVLYSFAMKPVDLISIINVPISFSIILILYNLIPDFKPRIFLPFAFLFFVYTIYICNVEAAYGDVPVNLSFVLRSFIMNIFFAILIIKILYYNNTVKIFVNTFEINKLNENLASANKEIENQKDELQNYNDNLEVMVQVKTKTIVGLKNAIMETIAELVERRDNATGGHISRTSRFLKIVVDAMIVKGINIGKTVLLDTEQIIMSAQLHDVGKIAIDDSILRKPGKLDNDEFEAMKRHTIIGGEIIKEIQNKTEESEFLEYAYTFAVYHHEKWDGTGYPFGIAAEKIPLLARLMALIDVYDALISERPYKKAFTHEEAIKIITDGKGTHFDPVLTDLFLSVADQLIIEERKN
jgi:putative two-component system response regulator